MDNIEVTKFSELSGYLKTKSPNDIVNVEVLRDDVIKVIPVTLSKSETVMVDFMDMQLRNIPNDIKKEYNIESGVIVAETENAWLYRRLGISRGYVITGINDNKIKSIEDISVLKNKYGSDFSKNLKKIEFINRNLEKKEVIFDR